MADLPKEPVTRQEMYLSRLAGENTTLPIEPVTREEMYLEGAIDRVEAVEQEVEEMKDNPDVADIVATYADLQAYDTSKLTDKDIIRVLADETHDGQSTYYRYNKQSDSWTYIGAAGDYYTKTAADAKFQDKLTAGTNVSISAQNVISATDTTYSAFTGTDGTTAGVAGLVPAPATTDAGKYLKADGTWATVQAGPTVVQTTGTSQTDVMSQNAVTSMIWTDPSTKNNISIRGAGSDVSTGTLAVGIGNAMARGTQSVAIGQDARIYAAGSYSVAIGNAAKADGKVRAVALGNSANAAYDNSVAIGTDAVTTAIGQVNIGAGTSGRGYNNTNYRTLSGVHDPVDNHDAATKGYVDGLVGNVAAALNAINNGTGA